MKFEFTFDHPSEEGYPEFIRVSETPLGNLKLTNEAGSEFYLLKNEISPLIDALVKFELEHHESAP